MELVPQAADADLATTASRFSIGELSAARRRAPLRREVSFIHDPRPSSFLLCLGQARLQHSAGASRRKPSVRQAMQIDKKLGILLGPRGLYCSSQSTTLFSSRIQGGPFFLYQRNSPPSSLYQRNSPPSRSRPGRWELVAGDVRFRRKTSMFLAQSG
jgi:hypothetical protein